MSPFRIIIIDPDNASREYLAREFKMAGFDVKKTDSLKEGMILAFQNQPHVIVLDPVMDEAAIKEMLDHFRKDLRLSRTRFFAFSSLESPSQIQRAIDLGFDEFLRKEANALSKLIDLAGQAATIARNDLGDEDSRRFGLQPVREERNVKSEGKSIIFLSSKGGVGTSSLCVNIAQIAANEKGRNIAVADLVLPIGSIETIVGTQNSVNIVEAAARASSTPIADFLQESLSQPPNWDLHLLPGSRSPEESDKLDINQIPLILDTMRQQHEYIFVDFGKSLSRISLPVILSADLIVFVLSLEKITVEQTKSVYSFLKKKGVREDHIYFLINRSIGLEGLTKSEVEAILGTTIQLAIPYMGRNFTLSNNLNMPISTKFPQDAVTLSLRQAADEIFRRINNRHKPPNFL